MGGQSSPEYRRAYYLKNRDRILRERREFRARNRDRLREEDRRRHDPEQMRAWRLYFKHGMRAEDWLALCEAQDGRCYLCGDELPQAAVIDHDHSHCPAEQSCRICRRGLACANCNSSIGLASDDPERLRRMADALEAAQAAVVERKAQACEQDTLFA